MSKATANLYTQSKVIASFLMLLCFIVALLLLSNFKLKTKVVDIKLDDHKALVVQLVKAPKAKVVKPTPQKIEPLKSESVIEKKQEQVVKKAQALKVKTPKVVKQSPKKKVQALSQVKAKPSLEKAVELSPTPTPTPTPAATPATAPAADSGANYQELALKLLLQRIEKLKEYPRQARVHGIEGRCQLQLVIKNSKVIETYLKQKSNKSLIDRACLKLAKKLQGFILEVPNFSKSVITPIVYSLKD